MELLTRYWVKHIGCRLAQIGAAISPGLIEFLDGAPELTHVQMGFEIREGIVAVMSHLAGTHGEGEHSLWLGPATGHLDRTSGLVVQVSSHVGINWLRLWYDYDFVEATGSVDFRRARVELPRDWSIDPSSIAANCRICLPEDR